VVKCQACLEPIPRSTALIRGGVSGAACIEAYFRCPACGEYTLAVYVDSLSGPDTVTLYGPLAAATTEAKLAIIARCPDPLNRSCQCAAHKEYLAAWLDEVWRGAG
jgi:hypothetical protein